MRFINVWSYKCADYLMKQLKDSHEKRNVYYYGFQIVLGSIVKAIIFFLVTYLLGIFIPSMLVLLFFGFIRIIAGGYHMDKFNKCLITSLGMFVMAAFISKYVSPYLAREYLMASSGLIFILGMYVLIRWAPGDTPNKPITKPEKIRRFKTISIVNICIWLVGNVVLSYFNLKMYALAGCLGTLLALFIVSPAGYSFFGMISTKFDIKKKKVRQQNAEL